MTISLTLTSPAENSFRTYVSVFLFYTILHCPLKDRERRCVSSSFGFFPIQLFLTLILTPFLFSQTFFFFSSFLSLFSKFQLLSGGVFRNFNRPYCNNQRC